MAMTITDPRTQQAFTVRTEMELLTLLVFLHVRTLDAMPPLPPAITKPDPAFVPAVA